MKIILVDDEPPARALLREYLAGEDDAEIVAACENGRAAVEAINRERPDLVFLDVQMPGLEGFEVLERLDRLPQVIFSTAYDDYALDAFEAGAADYLLKPYSRERFQKAMGRAREALKRGQDPSEELLGVLRAARRQRPCAPPERLFVRQGRRIVPVETGDICWIEADGDYAKLHTPEQTFLHSAGIGALEERLAGAERFLRVHRSHLIALPAVEHLTSDGQGGYVATLRLGEKRRKVRVSRSYAPAVRELVD